MTQKFIGQFEFKNDVLVKEESKIPIPPKQEWNKYSIWEFNGKRYRPVTRLAQDNLTKTVSDIMNAGYTCARKAAKIKPSTIAYAICTLGVEDFKFSK